MPTVLVVDDDMEMARLLATNRVVALEKTMRVLVIDDDVAYRMACTAVLAEDGHDVVPCGSARGGVCRPSLDARAARRDYNRDVCHPRFETMPHGHSGGSSVCREAHRRRLALGVADALTHVTHNRTPRPRLVPTAVRDARAAPPRIPGPVDRLALTLASGRADTSAV